MAVDSDFEIESIPVSSFNDSDFTLDEEATKKNIARILAGGAQATGEATGATLAALQSPAAGEASREGRFQNVRQRTIQEMPPSRLAALARFGPTQYQPSLPEIAQGIGKVTGAIMEPFSEMGAEFLRSSGLDPSAQAGKPVIEKVPFSTDLPLGLSSPLAIPGTIAEQILPEAVQSLKESVGKILGGFTEPGAALTAPLLGIEGGVSKAAGLLFGSEQLAQLPESVQHAVEVLKDPNATNKEKIDAWVQPGVSAIVGGVMLKHGLEGRPAAPVEVPIPGEAMPVPPLPEGPRVEPAVKPEIQPEKGAPDASKVQEAATVHGDLQPFAVQGEGQVPAQEGGAGVQPQAGGRLPEGTPGEVLLTPEKPTIAKAGESATKNNLGDPLGTTYHATPEDWKAWQEATSKPLMEGGVLNTERWAEQERLKNAYGGMPPEAPKEAAPPVVRDVPAGSVAPETIVPAIRLIGGEVVSGKAGETHPDIIKREGLKAEDIDQRGFSDPAGKQFFLDREAAAKGTQVATQREPGRLHSTDLQKEAEAPKGIISGSALEAWADNVIKTASQRMRAGLDPELFAAGIVKGAAIIERGVTEFAKWSAEMVKQFGEQIKPHLKDLFEKSKGLRAESLKNPSLASEVPKTTQALPKQADAPLPSPSAPDPLDQASHESTRASLPEKIRTAWRSFSMQSLPRITGANREAGEAGVRMAASIPVAQMKGEIFADKVLGTKNAKFDLKFGTALTEDNLRSIKAEAEKAGAPVKVTSLIGKENSPFRTEKEYQDFLKSSQFQEALQRHKALWAMEKDPLFRQANDLDPDVELASRGLQTGARVNLKAVMKDEGTKTTVGPASRGGLIRQSATLRKLNPFARKATGLGSSYEGSYTEIMKNGFGKEYPVAKQHQFIKALIDSGNALLSDKEFPGIEINGEATKGYLMRLGPFRNRWLQVPKSLAPEYQAASGLDAAKSWSLYTKAANFFTKQSVVGLAEGSTHVSNLASSVFTGLGPTGNPMLNALIKSAGRPDVLYSLPKILINAFSDRRADMMHLAEIGATKQPFPGGNWFGTQWVLKKVDKGTRLYARDVYKKLAANGWVPDTETGLREYVNQLGQYNKKLQPALIRDLRDTGIQPFATAMQNFNVQGLRQLVAAPGAKGTSNMAALALRADKAANLMGFAVLVGTLNYMVSGTATGPKGTKLGAVGWIGDDKKLHQLDLGALTGMSRGARITGIQPAIEAARLGLSPNSVLKSGVYGAANTALSTAVGPLNRALVVAATGARPGMPMVQEAPVVPPRDELAPLKSQAAANIATALKEANPAVDFAVRMAQGKPGEAVTRQFSRYAPKTGISTETIAALPKIVKSAEINAYADSLAKEARKIPMKDRGKWIMDRLNQDQLTPEVKGRAMIELRRKGAWNYQ